MKFLILEFQLVAPGLMAMFIERGLEPLRPGGSLGVITSRAGFFPSSYRRWRAEVVLGLARPEAMANRSYGGRKDALVEAAAYAREGITSAWTEAA